MHRPSNAVSFSVAPRRRLPGKGPERETDPATTYTANLTRYVDEARGIGARPVLVTSLARRIFDKAGSGRIVSTQTPYVGPISRAISVDRGVGAG